MRNTHDDTTTTTNVDAQTDNTREKIARNLSRENLSRLNATHFYNNARTFSVTENHAFSGIVNGDAVMICARGTSHDADARFLILRFCGIVVHFNDNGTIAYNVRLCPIVATTDDAITESDATTFDVFPRRADNIDEKRAIYRENARAKRERENAGKTRKSRESRNTRATIATDATELHRALSVTQSDVTDAHARLSQLRATRASR